MASALHFFLPFAFIGWDSEEDQKYGKRDWGDVLEIFDVAGWRVGPEAVVFDTENLYMSLTSAYIWNECICFMEHVLEKHLQKRKDRL